MGKESKLRAGREYEPAGSGRALFDRDKMPEGCDHDVWHLTLYFDQKCEESGVGGQPGRPVIYEELKFRLTNCPPPDIRARARTSGITVHWSRIVELMIDYFFNYYDGNYYAINSFTDVEVFDYYLDYVVDTLEREQLLREGVYVAVEESRRQPSKRTEEQAKRDKIRQRVYSEEEVKAKMAEFRSRT